MKKIAQPISLQDIKAMAQNSFGDFVKAVVDVEQGIMAVDAELHADEESFLLEGGSKQENLWGINIYPDLNGEERIEFDSMINIKPNQNNRSRSVGDPQIRAAITKIVLNLIKDELSA